MNTGDLLRQMNEDFTKGQLDILPLEAFDYLSNKTVKIQVVRNNYTFALNPMALVRLKREFKKKGVVYRRTRAEEIRARQDYLEQEQSRIQECIESARSYDKHLYLQDEIDKYERRRNVPDFSELVRVYKALYPKYDAPNEWWLDEVYVSNTITDWLEALASDSGTMGVSALDRKSKKFVKSRADQKANGARGGEIKAERRYQQFVKWVEDTKFKVGDYIKTSNVNFALILKDKGFVVDDKPISPNTAASYRTRYLSDLEQSIK